jgi:Fic family protein
MVMKTHSILLAGAIDPQRMPVLAGKYRDHPVHSGTGYQYPEADRIKPNMTSTLTSYNKNCLTKVNALSVVARLFYDLITLHPFVDGNGRLGRIIAAFAMIQMGWSLFPVAISSWHHKKARTHYLDAIQRMDRMKDLSHLSYLVLLSLLSSWSNFAHNAEMYSNDAISEGKE